MAETAKNKVTKTEPDADKPVAEANPEPTYHVDRLLADSEDFFGQPSHVVAGALHGEGNKKNFTLTEVNAAIQSWLSKEVTTEA